MTKFIAVSREQTIHEVLEAVDVGARLRTCSSPNNWVSLSFKLTNCLGQCHIDEVGAQGGCPVDEVVHRQIAGVLEKNLIAKLPVGLTGIAFECTDRHRLGFTVRNRVRVDVLSARITAAIAQHQDTCD